MTLIEANAVRDDGWWVAEFSLEGKEFGTQARRLDQLESMIKDAASLMTGEPAEEFDVNINPSGFPVEVVEDYESASQALKEAEKKLSVTSRSAVSALLDMGLTMRDVGRIMGISTQRVSQLSKP